MNNNSLNQTAAKFLCVLIAIPTIAPAASISGQGAWETTLQGRDLDGDFSNGFEAYFDAAQNITWLVDASYAHTTGYQALNNGRMTWFDATEWVNGLDPYGSGVTGWRLPRTVDVGNDGNTYTNQYQGVDVGYNITAHSEMSHMYYATLGNLAWYDISGTPTGCPDYPDYCLSNTGPFNNIQWDIAYWSGTEYAPNTNSAWGFGFGDGFQGNTSKGATFFAWAVHDGNVGVAIPSAVPIPGAVWLFGSGLLGLLAMARKRRSLLLLKEFVTDDGQSRWCVDTEARLLSIDGQHLDYQRTCGKQFGHGQARVNTLGGLDD